MRQKLKKAAEDAVKVRNSLPTNKEKTEDKSAAYKAQVQQLRHQVQKHEANEKRFKNMMIEKENEFEQERIEMKRMINAERKRVKDL